MDTKLLRMGEVAKALNLSRTQAYELARRGELPIIRLGNSLRVPEGELDRMIKERTVRPPAA